MDNINLDKHFQITNLDLSTSITLAIYGDMIAYSNGNYDFINNTAINSKYNDDIQSTCVTIVSTKLSDFYYKGGFIKNYGGNTTFVSDLFRLMVETIINKNSYVKNLELYIQKKSHINMITPEMQNKLKSLKIGDSINYDEQLNMPFTFSQAIAIAIFYSDVEKIIQYVVDITVITNPNIIAILGAVSIALFVHFSIKKVDINVWLFSIKELIENISKYIKSKYKQLYREQLIMNFINKIDTFIRLRFDKNKIYKHDMIYEMFIYRPLFYYNNIMDDKSLLNPGVCADDAIIMIYDFLIDSNNNFEYLFIHSALHPGLSNVTAFVCNFLYGLIYEENTINIVEYISDNKLIKKISKLLAKKNI